MKRQSAGVLLSALLLSVLALAADLPSVEVYKSASPDPVPYQVHPVQTGSAIRIFANH